VKILTLRFGILAGACALTLSAGSITVGVDTGGNSFPFGQPISGPGTVYQEAYSSTLFSGPISITGIDFFLQPDGPNTLYQATFSLSLSTISAGVNTLSDTNFESNLGPDNSSFTTVSLSGDTGSVLSFTGTPFVYNPADGNLLLNIQITDIISTGNAAFEDGDGDGPSTIARYQNFGTGTTGYGLVTEFNFTPVPEPASFGFLAVGLGGMIFFAYRRKWTARAAEIGSTRSGPPSKLKLFQR